MFSQLFVKYFTNTNASKHIKIRLDWRWHGDFKYDEKSKRENRQQQKTTKKKNNLFFIKNISRQRD